MTVALALAAPRSVSATSDVRDLARTWQSELTLQVRSGELSSATEKTYAIGMARFLGWAERRRAVSGEVIREWISDLRDEGCAPSSINTWLAGVRSFFAWAVRNRHLPYDPCSGIRGARRTGTSSKHRRDPLNDTEIGRVLEAPDVDTPKGKRDSAILAMMAYCAARQSDLHRADVGDLTTTGERRVLAVRGKGRIEKDEVLVIANPSAELALRNWIAARGDAPGALFVSLSRRTHGDRLSLRACRGLVKGYFRCAGVHGSRKTTHSLRHSAITNAVRHGAPVQKVQAMARHANIATTMIYYHETDRVENPAERFIRYGGDD